MALRLGLGLGLGAHAFECVKRLESMPSRNVGVGVRVGGWGLALALGTSIGVFSESMPLRNVPGQKMLLRR